MANKMIESIRKDLYRWYGKENLNFIEKMKAFRIPQIKFVKKKRLVDYYRGGIKYSFFFTWLVIVI